MIKKSLKLVLAALVFGAFWGISITQAAVVVTPATGGQNLPEGSGFVNLNNIFIKEEFAGEIDAGPHTFSLPAGWEFDTSSEITIVHENTIMAVYPEKPFKPGSSSFFFEIQRESDTPFNKLTIIGMRVRPTGTAGGNITHSGATITGVTNGVTSFGTLSVAGGSTPTVSVDTYSSFSSGGSLKPIAPTDISIKINSGASNTDSRNVVLKLGASGAGDMIIANDSSNFEYSTLEVFSETKNWTLSKGNGTKTVYVKFRSPTGVYSDAISASITLNETETVAEQTSTVTSSSTGSSGSSAPSYKSTDLNKDGVVDVKDLNLFFANWFNANKISDVNGDGKVDISDFNAILADWTNSSVPANIADSKDASFSISPSFVEVKKGESVSVVVKINPISNSIYTARLVLNYPSDLLSYDSAVFANGWVPLILGENSNLIDSQNGIIIKTAGYPGGVPMNGADFAVISFTAKKTGSGNISTNAGTVAMNKKGFDKYSGNLSQSSILVLGAPVAPVSSNIAAAPVSTSENIAPVSEDKTETTETERKGLLAGIIGFFTSVPGFLFIIVLLALIAYWLYIRFFSSPDDEEEDEKKFAAIIERERERE